MIGTFTVIVQSVFLFPNREIDKIDFFNVAWVPNEKSEPDAKGDNV